MSSQTWWYVSRSSGIVAWILLAVSVFWGVALSSRFLGKKPKPNWMLDLHRYLGGLAVTFTLVHVAALIADGFVTITIVNVLVPFTGTFQTTAMAWGIVALYLLVAVELTSLFRKRLSKRLWRAIHYLSFPLFAAATVHLLLIGTDRTAIPLRVAVLVAAAVVCTATLARTIQADHQPTASTPP